MALQDVDVQYVWRFLREHNVDLAARKSWCESNDPEFAAKAADVVGLYIDPPAKVVRLEFKICFIQVKTSGTFFGSSPGAAQRSTWKASVSGRRCLASHSKGVFETTPRSR